MAASGSRSGAKEDAYWAPPEAEAPRLARIEAAIQGCKKIPGRDFGYEGLAAYGRDPNNILQIIYKSQNDNAILWYFYYDASGKPQIVTFWLNIEPSTRAEQLAKGNPSLMTPMDTAQSLLGGVNVVEMPESKRYIVNMRAEQVAGRKMDLMVEKGGSPCLIGQLNGTKARIEAVYIQLRRGLTPAQLLSPQAIEQVRIYGTAVEKEKSTFGQRICECINPADVKK